MAKIVIKAASLLIHSKQLAAHSNTIEFSAEAEKVACTTFASEGWEESLQGIRSTALGAQLYFENAAEPELTLNTILEDATSCPFTATMTYPPAAGDIALFTKVVPLSLLKNLKVGELYGASTSFGPQSDAVRGKVLEYNTGRTATGNSAELELAATSSTQRLFIAVHVLSASGTSPTLDIILQSDATGFASPTNRITVPQFTGAGSYITYLAGPITDDFYRVNATIGGSATPTFAYLVAIGIAPNA